MKSTFLRDFLRRLFLGVLTVLTAIGFMAFLAGLQYKVDKKENFQIQLIDQPPVINHQAFENKAVEVKKTEKKKPKKPKSDAAMIADEIVRVSQNSEIKDRLDKQVFTDDFFVALQFQESRAEQGAVSSRGAKGKYQVTPIAVKAVVEYLENLKIKNGLDYRGPSMINDLTAKKIANLFARNPQYDEASGKLYFLSIHDKDSQYNQKPNRDVFRGKSIKEQQRLSLYCYWGGPELRLKPAQVERSGRQYVKNIFGFMKTAKILRKQICQNYKHDKKEVDQHILKIMKEMEDQDQDPRNYAALERKNYRRHLG